MSQKLYFGVDTIYRCLAALIHSHSKGQPNVYVMTCMFAFYIEIYQRKYQVDCVAGILRSICIGKELNECPLEQ